MMAAMDPSALAAHRLNNLLHSLLLLGGLGGLLALTGWWFAGMVGAFWAFGAGLGALLLGPQVSPRLVLRAYGARHLHPHAAPDLYRLMEALAVRAELPRIPALYYIPSEVPNAFAVGSHEAAAIALTDGLLRRLVTRELAGVLAHEVSHLRHRDLWLMGLADTVSRLTILATQVGWVLLAILFAGSLLGLGSFPLLAPLFLLAVPILSTLLQLALSRTREFHADLGAAALTGDPEGLASALAKLECGRGRWWERLLFPGRREPDPALLRTHPHARERIRRLLALGARPAPALPECGDLEDLLAARGALRRPRWHVTGLWH